MTILFLTFAVAFTAFCVWLTVRIVNRQERWAKWTLVVAVIGAPVLYLASFGPACWISSRIEPSGETVSLIYRPVAWIIWNGPDWITNPIGAYAFCLSAEGTTQSVSNDPLRISFEEAIRN